jgi:hypothetical protein
VKFWNVPGIFLRSGRRIQFVSKHGATSFQIKTENSSNRDRCLDRAVAEMYSTTTGTNKRSYVRRSLSIAANLEGVQTRFFLVDVYKG